MRFVALEKLINLHDGYRREFRLDYHRLLLVQLGEKRYILEAQCPHQEHPLSEAWIGDGVIECPLHGYRFKLDDGELVHCTEEECRGLRTWPVEYEGSEVGVLWDDS